jgi:hypothetical protein
VLFLNFFSGLELIYAQTPDAMRGIALGIFWLFSGVGSFLSYALTVIGYKRWFFDWDDGDPNCHKCRMEYFYYIQAILAFVGLVGFLIFTDCCRIGFDYKYDDGREGRRARGGGVEGVSPDIRRSVL